MTELELKKILGQEIEIPDQVEERIRQACAQAKPAQQKVRRSRRPLRIGAVAVAACAALSVGALAVNFSSHGAVYQAFFGNESHTSTVYTEEYDEYGNLRVGSLNEERVPVDEEQAEALVGEYLEDTGYVWQVGEYTLTVESYLLDENTGTAKVSYSLHRPGGIEGAVVDGSTGHIYIDGGNLPHFCALIQNEERASFGTYIPFAGHDRVDLTRSAEDTLYITSSMAEADWSAADGMQIEFEEETLVLPAMESLPAVTVNDPETGEPAAIFSAIGLKIWVDDMDRVDYVALTYADGTQYVLKDKASNLYNTDYACGHGKRPNMEVQYCFNRLVDPEQVVAVTVNGTIYTVE